MHISTVNISQTVTDNVNIATATNRKSLAGFRLAYLNLTLACSKGQLSSWNGVPANIMTIVNESI